MAPWQHLRTTLGKPGTSRLAFSTSIVLGVTLALSACGAQQPGAAAIVNGVAISDHDVQTVSDQLNTLSQGGQKLSSSNTLLSLILAPYVHREAGRAHQTVSASEARKAIEKLADPAPATVDFVQTRLEVQKLDQASRTSIVSELAKAKITINPRYGTLDPQQVVLAPTSPNWLKGSAPSPTK